MIKLVRRERYAVRAVLERHNMSAPEIRLDKEHRRELSRDEILRTIRKLPTLDSFTQAELDTLSGYCHVKTYYKNESVFSSGDYNEEVCIVLKGKVRLIANRESNISSAPTEIALLRAGQFIGESCLSRNVFRLSGTAVEFTELLCISKAKLNALMETDPVIGVKLLRKFIESLSDKIARTNDVLRHTADYDANTVILPSG